MKNFGKLLLVLGLIVGVVSMVQLESLRITMATKMVQDSNDSNIGKKSDIVNLSRKIAVKSNKISRIIYLPYSIMFLGGLLILLSKRAEPAKGR
jgi:hypothetical protein